MYMFVIAIRVIYVHVTPGFMLVLVSCLGGNIGSSGQSDTVFVSKHLPSVEG